MLKKIRVGRWVGFLKFFLLLFFFYTKSTWNTEAKSSQIYVHSIHELRS